MLAPQQPSSIPHPNQIRSACARCRRQKLRCTRSPAASPSCARCTRLKLPCQAGPQRRIGRPPKKDLVVVREGSGAAAADAFIGPVPLPATIGAGFKSPISVDSLQLLDDGLLDDSIMLGFDWPMACDPAWSFASPWGLNLPMECWPGVRELEAPPECEQQIMTPSPRLFEMLSRLNLDIHRCNENMGRFETQPSFMDFICTPHPVMDGYKNIQLLMVNAQEYLSIIKELHHQVGTRPVAKPDRSASPDIISMNIDPSLSGSSTPTSDASSPASTSTLPKKHDSPTMFLVISCYVQLIKHIELLIKIVYDSVNDPTTEPIGRAPMSYADVPIVEASSQFIIFFEIVHHVVAQTNLVLGLPSRWTGRSGWTGIIRYQRYRDLVNAELGSVEGLWTTRPTRLLECIKMSKEIFTEVSMLGIEPENPLSSSRV